jgi:hypothetical protein
MYFGAIMAQLKKTAPVYKKSSYSTSYGAFDGSGPSPDHTARRSRDLAQFSGRVAKLNLGSNRYTGAIKVNGVLL